MYALVIQVMQHEAKMQNMSNVMQPIMLSMQSANHMRCKCNANMDKYALRLAWDNM